ncbi:MAG: hypothetical protein CVU87_01270 [Firmicutes bacterium HGW-Firmicutes-12]|jgi:hypothetical protein|nr:MAG: hypothetical protein CVU87_01270 [Firmicutes bacterium HGW-Firmicutes-12]
MRLRGFIIGGAILSIIVGFVVGKTVDAGAPEPGSSADPVVSKSYVDKALEERVGELELEVAEITVQAQALQTTINELQDKLNKSGIKTTPTTSTPSTSTPSTTTPSTTTGTTTGATIGKTAYIKSSNNYVNLRSGPSTDTNTIKQVQKGEAMKIFEVKDQWYHVELADKTVGWVASWIVDVK